MGTSRAGTDIRQGNGKVPPAAGALRDERRVAALLGWASLGLAVPQIASPARFDRLVGVHAGPRAQAITVLACGVRELTAATGLLVLARRRPAPWLWARAAGDALDLALLGRALQSGPPQPVRVGGAIGLVIGITAADVLAAVRSTRRARREPAPREGKPLEVGAAITVRRPPDEVYDFWRDLRNLPSFMYHLKSVEPSGDGRWRWKAKAPVGSVKWQAQIVEDRRGELISWRSVEGSRIENSGSVRFAAAPRDQGTEIRLSLRYRAPGGSIGAALAKLTGEEPTQQVKDDLRRFKQVMETGEVIRSDASPEGQTARRLLRQRPAKPPTDAAEMPVERSYA